MASDFAFLEKLAEGRLVIAMFVEAPLFIPPHEAERESGGEPEGVTVLSKELGFAQALEERSFEGGESF